MEGPHLFAMNTIRMKSLDNNATIPATEAPSTFRMPISFIRCSAAKAESPNNPKQAIRMAIRVKYSTIPEIC